MEENSQILLAEYAENQDPISWNLTDLKAKMPDYEIYIINDQLKIINTTLKADLGMDFSRYREFSKLLYSRLESGSFAADKLDLGQNTGLINKYSYQATSDSRYLFELSIDISKRFPILGDFNIFANAEELVEKYEQLQSINFYKFGQDSNRVGLLKSSNPDDLEPVSAAVKTMIKTTVLENEIQNSSFAEANYQVTDFYLPFLVKGEETDSEWWNSFVVRVRYDNQNLLQELSQERTNIIFKIIVVLISFIIFSIIMHYFIKNTETIAYHDCLTGLPNRQAFQEYFNQKNLRKPKGKTAILYLDLDGFKGVNDKYGHEIGDKLLQIVAGRLKNSIRSKDKVSRIGGDEFTILLTNIKKTGDVEMIIDKIENIISEPYQIDGHKIKISCSIGYSIANNSSDSLKKLLNQADKAMYEIKNEKNKME
jgi:diguanylate cyclase (GGDEF)-like protein